MMLLLVLTGNGKGKSSSAFGMLARTLGHGLKAGVCWRELIFNGWSGTRYRIPPNG
jgi:ATP:corrinoid adenosyltransferase